MNKSLIFAALLPIGLTAPAMAQVAPTVETTATATTPTEHGQGADVTHSTTVTTTTPPVESGELPSTSSTLTNAVATPAGNATAVTRTTTDGDHATMVEHTGAKPAKPTKPAKKPD